MKRPWFNYVINFVGWAIYSCIFLFHDRLVYVDVERLQCRSPLGKNELRRMQKFKLDRNGYEGSERVL